MHFIKVAYGTDDGYPDRPYAATNLLTGQGTRPAAASSREAR